MFRRALTLLIVLAVLAGAAVGIWYRQGQRARANPNTLTLLGNIDLREVQLAFNDSDRIATMPVKEGDSVTKGELVATLDAVRAQAAYDQAKAQVAAQRAALDRLLAGSRPQEIAKARADVAVAEAGARDAQLVYQQTKELRSQNAATTRELDRAKAARDQAVAQRHSLQQVLELAVLGPRKQDIDQAKAVLAANQATLANAKRILDDTKLYAPAAGVIRNRLLEPGDIASPQTPVCTLALTKPLWARAYVPEPDLGKIRPGMSATVTSDSYPGKTYAGRIGFISPSAEFTPKTVETSDLRSSLVYEVRIFIDHPQNQLRLGMPVTVAIHLSQNPNRR